MSQTLSDIARYLQSSDKKVQLIYAFNSTGKTRLLREFKELVAPKIKDENTEPSRHKILYYSTFTEDLFFWDKDPANKNNPKLKIQPNNFTDWILKDQGQDQNIITSFQRYAGNALTPKFNTEFTEVTFSIERGNSERSSDLKISKGEESLFIWSIFHALLEQVNNTRNIVEPSDRDTDEFDQLEYVFIEDPVSSLDENNLIELAVELAMLVKDGTQSSLNFIITTHNALFYNVLHNELGLSKEGKKEGCYLLEHHEDGTFNLNLKFGDSNRSFSYHLYLKQTLERAIADNKVQRYHFTLLRNLYEKTAGFLGYPKWQELLPDDKQAYLNRIIQFTSHSTLSNEAVAQPSLQEKQTLKVLLENLMKNYSYCQQDSQND
ncbi:MAG: anticodon nuclease [Gammaproteobacteria bacterium]|nr:anticodon nuclease [Gammaproteobacteria bacterium]